MESPQNHLNKADNGKPTTTKSVFDLGEPPTTRNDIHDHLHQDPCSRNWRQDFFYWVGEIESQYEMYRCQIVLQARIALQENDITSLINLSGDIRRFERRTREIGCYKQNYTESVARVLEFIGKAFINQMDFQLAIERLELAESIIQNLKQEFPDYNNDQPLEISISKSLRYAKGQVHSESN